MDNYYNSYTVQPNTLNNPQAQVDATADSAFSKSLASVILANFPIASIVAIFMGNAGMKLANSARDLAARYGVSAGGKCTAARIMGLIGLIYGIVNTVVWTFVIIFYCLYILFLISVFSMY